MSEIQTTNKPKNPTFEPNQITTPQTVQTKYITQKKKLKS